MKQKIKSSAWEAVDYLSRVFALLFGGTYHVKGFFTQKIEFTLYLQSALGLYLALWLLSLLLAAKAPRYSGAEKCQSGLPPDWLFLINVIYVGVSFAYLTLGTPLTMVAMGLVPPAIFWGLSTAIFGLPTWRWQTSVARLVAFYPTCILIADGNPSQFVIASAVSALVLLSARAKFVHTPENVFLGAPLTKAKENFFAWMRWANSFALSGATSKLILGVFTPTESAIVAAVCTIFFVHAAADERKPLLWGYLTSVGCGFTMAYAFGKCAAATAVAAVATAFVIWLITRLWPAGKKKE